MKIYTKRGDQGETDLFGAGRVPKDHLRVQAYGEVDELNALIGLSNANTADEDLSEKLCAIQRELFALGSYLATPDADRRAKAGISEPSPRAIHLLEEQIDSLESELAPLASFILPGGGVVAANLHHARAVCRRAERALVALGREEALDETALQYLNRLSDLLFVMARVANKRGGFEEIPWKP